VWKIQLKKTRRMYAHGRGLQRENRRKRSKKLERGGNESKKMNEKY
jgi:hypothetical protein